jgi:hypothetical protein
MIILYRVTECLHTELTANTEWRSAVYTVMTAHTMGDEVLTHYIQ